VFFLASGLLAEDTVVVPDGIQYKPTSDRVNQEARKVLTRLFSTNATEGVVLASFQTNFVICGPGLWLDIKNDAAVSRVNTGVTNFQVPVLDNVGKISRMDKLEGKLFQSKDEVMIFWKAFTKRTDFTGLKIRHLNQEELRIYWAMIPYDITEPVFILESSKHKVLTVFTSPDKLKILWMDDYQNLCLKKENTTNNTSTTKGSSGGRAN
jgi:hypothetical protein